MAKQRKPFIPYPKAKGHFFAPATYGLRVIKSIHPWKADAFLLWQDLILLDKLDARTRFTCLQIRYRRRTGIPTRKNPQAECKELEQGVTPLTSFGRHHPQERYSCVRCLKSRIRYPLR